MGLYKFYYSVDVDDAELRGRHGRLDHAGRLHQRAGVVDAAVHARDAGNPALKPTTADQLDLTYEWYFSSTGSFTGGACSTRSSTTTSSNVRSTQDFTNNGVTRTVNVTQPGERRRREACSGFEVAYQTFFDRLPDAVEWPRVSRPTSRTSTTRA